MNWEDDAVISQRDAEFQQKIIASTLLADPELKVAQALFPATSTSGAQLERNAEGDLIMSPTSDEEFDEMIRMLDEMDALGA